MDLVYILGSGSRWSDNEIRYSIRSAVKYFNFRDIYIIGEYPTWMKKAIHIPASDDQPLKIQNSINKQIIAAKLKNLSEDYLLMNDDFFFLKPVDEIKVYYRGKTGEFIKKHKQKRGYYYDAMIKTDRELRKAGIEDPKDYAVHCPIVINKKKFLNMINFLGKDANTLLIRTAYGNLNEIGGKRVVDFKALDMPKLKNQLRRKNEFLSISDALVLSRQFRDWIGKVFPEVSEYENDDGKGVNDEPGQPLNLRQYRATKEFQHGSQFYSSGQMVDKETAKKILSSPRNKDLLKLI